MLKAEFDSQIEGENFTVKLVEFLARGATSAVFRATVVDVKNPSRPNLSLSENVAVKKMRLMITSESSLDTAAMQREIAISTKEGSTLYKIDQRESEDVDVVYLIQPLLNGQTLRELIYHTDPQHGVVGKKVLPSIQKNIIAYGLLREMESFHLLSIVHADLKPDNIIFDPATNTVKIFDFGNSFDCTQDYRPSRYQGSTTMYAPKIEYEENKIDTFKSDNFTLGVIIASLYSQCVYERDSIEHYNGNVDCQALLNDVLNEKPEDMPEDLYHIVAHLMQAHPENRPESILFARGILESDELKDLKAIHQRSIEFKKQIQKKLQDIATEQSDKKLNKTLKKIIRKIDTDVLNKHDDLPTIRMLLNDKIREFSIHPFLPGIIQPILNLIDEYCIAEARRLQREREIKLKNSAMYNKFLRVASTFMVDKEEKNLVKHSLNYYEPQKYSAIGRMLMSTANKIKQTDNVREIQKILKKLQSRVSMGLSSNLNGEQQDGLRNILQFVADKQEQLESTMTDHAHSRSIKRP